MVLDDDNFIVTWYVRGCMISHAEYNIIIHCGKASEPDNIE